MNYIDRTSSPGEITLLTSRLHWIIYMPGWLACLTIVLLPIGIPMLIHSWLRYHTTLFVVTNRRIVSRSGILSKSSIEMMVDKVEEVTFQQSFFGRMLNYGTVRIIGTGGSHEPFDFMANPSAFQTAVQTR
jgi:uncharacterized membrane protein YdbT with pleckstrin-like domain